MYPLFSPFQTLVAFLSHMRCSGTCSPTYTYLARRRRSLSPCCSCDFCHVNHQPCDNGTPKCSVCTKHNKPCLYLRPAKRRGPQKGYRTALNTYKESAAAWGAVLGAIPGLDALVEGHLRGAAGRAVVASIKDSNQQDALIAKWQQSSVFRAFFGHNGPPPALQQGATTGGGASDGSAGTAAAAVASQEADEEEADSRDETPPTTRSRTASQQPSASQRSQSVSSFAVAPEAKSHSDHTRAPVQPNDSFSDIVAKDAAQSYELSLSYPFFFPVPFFSTPLIIPF